MKLQAYWPKTLLKKGSNTGVLLRLLQYLRTPILTNIRKQPLMFCNIVGLRCGSHIFLPILFIKGPDQMSDFHWVIFL